MQIDRFATGMNLHLSVAWQGAADLNLGVMNPMVRLTGRDNGQPETLPISCTIAATYANPIHTDSRATITFRVFGDSSQSCTLTMLNNRLQPSYFATRDEIPCLHLRDTCANLSAVFPFDYLPRASSARL